MKAVRSAGSSLNETDRRDLIPQVHLEDWLIVTMWMRLSWSPFYAPCEYLPFETTIVH
jgi:hypothetical protein